MPPSQCDPGGDSCLICTLQRRRLNETTIAPLVIAEKVCKIPEADIRHTCVFIQFRPLPDVSN